MIRAGLFNFSKGEIAPALHGRIDVPAYSAALRLARNVTVLKYGGISRRMGTRMAYELREPQAGWDDPSAAARLMPFEYSIEQSYVLLMRQAEMAPLAYGGAVLEDELAIAGVTNEAEAQITSAFHGYAVGDEIFPTGILGEIGDLLNGRVWQVIGVVDDNTIRIDADTRGLEAFERATGGEERTEAPAAGPAAPDVPAPYVPPPGPVIYNGGNWKLDGLEGSSSRGADL